MNLYFLFCHSSVIDIFFLVNDHSSPETVSAPDRRGTRAWGHSASEGSDLESCVTLFHNVSQTPLPPLPRGAPRGRGGRGGWEVERKKSLELSKHRMWSSRLSIERRGSYTTSEMPTWTRHAVCVQIFWQKILKSTWWACTTVNIDMPWSWLT